MKIYVAEIDGRPIAAFNASTLSKAAEIIEDPLVMRDEFIVRGLCDEDTKISVRPASAEEMAEWKKLHGRTIMLGQFCPRDGEDEMLGIAFLIEAPDPTSGDMEN
jgi:hypothetical protein